MSRAEVVARWERVGAILPIGECKGCDSHRSHYLETGDEMFPRHAVNTNCANAPGARYPHCTCDACW